MGARTIPLVGRDEELRAIEEARADRRAGVIIVGEAGVGKSRLARSFASAVRGPGSRVLSIVATESATEVPFGAFAPLLPVAVHDADAFVMLRRATEWIARIGEGTRPPVLLVDDAQWLDPSSAMLVHQLVRARRVFFVATVRGDEPLGGALAGIWKDTDAVRLDLRMLDRAATRLLAEAMVGGSLERRAMQWLWDASGGNPLYLRELIASARSEQSLVLDRGIWSLVGMPRLAPALRDLLAVRMSELSESSRWVLALVSEGGPLPLAELLARTTEDILLDLEGRELIVAETGAEQEFVRIAHPLFATAIRSGLPPLHARRVARALAEILSERGVLRAGDVLRLVRWTIASGGSPEPALLVRAADEANAASLASEAETLAQRAVEASPTIDALLQLARAQISLRRYVAAGRTLAAVEPLLDTPERGLVYLEQQSDLWYWGMRDAARAREILARAVGWWDGERWLRGLEALQLRMLAFEPGETVAVPAALRTVRGEQLAPVRVANLLRLGRVREAYAESEAHRGLDGPPTTATIIARAVRARAVLDSGIGWSDYEREMTELLDRSTREDDSVAAGQSAYALAMLGRAAGRFRTARALAVEAEIRLERYDPFGIVPTVVCLQVECDCFMGDHDSAARSLARAEGLVRGSRLAHQAPLLTRAHAWVVHASGDHDRAQNLLMDAAAGTDAPMYAAGLHHEALRAGAPAERVVGALEDLRRRTDSPLAALFARQAVAVAAKDAESLLSVSAEFVQIGAFRDAAEASAQAASTFARAGRDDSARRAAARSRSFVPDGEGARAPVVAELEGVAATLTRRERQIASLAAGGVGNAEIARRLSLSVRTVESHLYRAMQKVGAADRRDFDL